MVATTTTTASVSSASAAEPTAPAPTTAAGGHRGRSTSEAKRRANRRNARKSTGPRTLEGKARSSRNATTHGIFCRDLLLDGEDARLFTLVREGFLEALKPQDAAQLALVDGAFAARWRLNRCQHAEACLIDRRVARQRERLGGGVVELERRLNFEELPSDDDGELVARCVKSSVYAEGYERWQQLRGECADLADAAFHPGHAVASLMERADAPLERLGRYEHRLESSFHRCLRDLHLLKQRAEAYADEPASPFLGVSVPAAAAAAAGDPRVESMDHPPSPLAGEGGGEGEARGVEPARSAGACICGVELARSADASPPLPRYSVGEGRGEGGCGVEVRRSAEELSAKRQAAAAACSPPHARHPLRTTANRCANVRGCAGTGASIAPAQNEPTAPRTTAGIAPAGTCGDRAAEPPVDENDASTARRDTNERDAAADRDPPAAPGGAYDQSPTP